MLRSDHELVSVDDHLVEHAKVWESRLPAEHIEQGPRIIEIAEDRTVNLMGSQSHVAKGSQAWTYEGRVFPQFHANTAAGSEDPELDFEATRFDQMRPGAYDPIARLEDMDRDGVAVQLPFPTFPGFAGSILFNSKDKALASLCVSAYNDFLIDEWCAAAPGRYIPIIIVPFWSPEESIAEIERCAAKGARGISFPDNPAGPMGLPSFFTDHWDGVFSAAADADLPLCMHFGGSRTVPQVSPDATRPVIVSLFGITLFNSMCEVVFSGTFERHPDLKVVYSEGGIGWFPYALQRIDQVWEKHRHYRSISHPLNPDVPPSEVLRRNVWGCFIDDPIGVQTRDVFGVDQLLWECDYPHADSLWPNSRSNAEAVFADVPDEEVEKIVSSNARKLFDFPKV